MAGTTTSHSILHINTSAKTTDIGPPIGQISTWLNNFSVTKNTHLFANLNKSFLKLNFFSHTVSVYNVINGFLYQYTCERDSTLYEISLYSFELDAFFN